MKVVINVCFGGFGLSRKAIARLAELQGRECYFFVNDLSNHKLDRFIPAPPLEDGKRDLFFTAFDVPNPNDVMRSPSGAKWASMTPEERHAHNEAYTSHMLDGYREKRDDPLLVRVVEELGEEASGACAKLRVVEIPDGTSYVIDEYDGNEHIAETHRTWR